MALDLGFGFGFLVGSLALLALVLYFTRIRGPTLPHEAMAEPGDAEGGDASPTARIAACEICDENPATRSVNDMAVCAECDEDLL